MQAETIAVAVPAGLARRLCRENGELAHIPTLPTRCMGLLAFDDAKQGKVRESNITNSDTALGQLRLYETVRENKVAERAGF